MTLAASPSGTALRLLKSAALMISIGVATAVGGAGLVHAQNRDTPTNPFARNPAAVEAGAKLFDGACAACHGPGASGGRGPALNTGSFAHGGEDYEIFSTIQNGVPAGGMPSFKALPAEDIWRLVSYVTSLSGSASPAPAVQAPGDPAAIARGEAIFFGKGQCASCHEVNGRGAVSAADLSAVGKQPAERIRAALDHVLRASRAAPAPRVAAAELADGRKVQGLVRREDNFRIHLTQPDGRVIMVDRADVRSLDTVTDAIPTDLKRRLTGAEMDDLVAYLSHQTTRKLDGSITPHGEPVLPTARLLNAKAEPQNWATYWGNYQSTHFSELDQIRPGNVAGLQAQWAAPLGAEAPLQSTPIVVDGVMYVSGAPGEVYALDAKSGLQLWKFTRKQDVTNPYQINPTNRGVAVLDGRVFMGTLDNLLIALDARTGRELWETRIADTMQGFTMTGAPLAAPGKVVVGVGGGEYAVRGFLAAYDPQTGKRLWRFDTIPGPGQPGNKTWAGESWKFGGGGTWLTGSFDAELNTLYWAVGNPAPSNDPTVRKGDNLYTNSVIALDPDTGKLKWHYQFTPNDSHDWDSVQAMVLADRVIDGKPRKVLLHADRNGFFYMLDRTNGQFLRGTAFVRQTWNDGFDKNGRPRVRPDSIATPSGVPVFPAVGGTNFQAPSYDERGGVFYVEFLDSQGFARFAPAEVIPGRTYRAEARTAAPPATATPIQGVKALDAASGKTLWTYPMSRVTLGSGLIATRGGLVFAATGDGALIAIDATSGAPLWWFRTGGPITASPISYALDGRQYVAISAGGTVYSFALPQQAAR